MKLLLFTILLLWAQQSVIGYPLDGYQYTGIRRLEFYRLAQTGEVNGRQLHPGALLPMQQVAPRWRGPGTLKLQRGRALSKKIARMLGSEADAYGVALLDLSDPAHPRYAEHNADMRTNVGSVGKLLVAIAVFQKLADLYPEDVSARERVLKVEGLVFCDKDWVAGGVPPGECLTATAVSA